ncbi:hypothetical protein Vadar_014530 [Vaccinium darrowii]|uniref:Uncharacterized protein n=1 Tax=Vaccinium darrowii TaxID=229202 RepID=A0ACB7YE72_9ERIC|nr:hypothetical protein Vadar_014530 [Vaccinium darrowii]
MEKAWKVNQKQKWAAIRLSLKLKETKEALKVWAKEGFGNMQHNLDQVELELHNLDIQAEEGNITETEKSLRRSLKVEQWKLSRALERMWLQKSRIKWHLLGDKNTKFFHSMASARQRRNLINSLLIDGNLIEEPEDIKLAVFKHFQQLYEEVKVERPLIGDDMGSTISPVFSSGGRPNKCKKVALSAATAKMWLLLTS